MGIYSADIKRRKAEIFERTVTLVKELIRDKGAECIIPLGGKLIPYLVDPVDLEKATGAPVLNTKAIGIQFAEMCVRNKSFIRRFLIRRRRQNMRISCRSSMIRARISSWPKPSAATHEPGRRVR